MTRVRKKRVTFMLDGAVLNELLSIRERTGLSTSEQIRQGIQWWLESRQWPTEQSLETTRRARAAVVAPRRRMR